MTSAGHDNEPFGRPSESRGTQSTLAYGFYAGGVAKATHYRRATGFFSGSVFQVNLSEYKSFFERGGRIEVVCSNRLGSRDLRSIFQGLYHARRWKLLRLADLQWQHPNVAFDLLSWGIAHSSIGIRIATVLHNPRAIYHEKFGIFNNSSTPLLGFHGSANETLAGLIENFERVDLFDSLDVPGRARCKALLYDFERLWMNDTPGLRVVPLLRALQLGMIQEIPPEDVGKSEAVMSGRSELSLDAEPEVLRLPDRFILRDYQLQAIRAWLAASGKGILEMATGTGKTVTALTAATKVFEGITTPLVVVIVAPYTHLVEQWCSEAAQFGLSPIQCFGSRNDWLAFAESAVFRINNGSRRVLSLAVTNATFCLAPFQHILGKIRVPVLLIADEVHNLGAARIAATLPSEVPLRMGLSATPTRWMDPHGTDLLLQYFGSVAFRFGLKEAIEHKPPVLVPYRYFPILVELDADEQQQYLDLTVAIGRCISDVDSAPLSELAVALLIKRSRLIASARQKLPALKQAILPFASLPHSLIYCSDSKFDFGGEEDPEQSAEEMRQIDAVTALLGHELGMQVAQFTAKTPQLDRADILRRFGVGDLQALVAIRCLDEGVNVPQITRAFILASSSNPRQFVQRRGRILRPSPGKDTAEIYDFVVKPPHDLMARDSVEFRAGRKLIQNEMRRVAEFASLARNGPEARLILLPILTEWDLLHL